MRERFFETGESPLLGSQRQVGEKGHGRTLSHQLSKATATKREEARQMSSLHEARL